MIKISKLNKYFNRGRTNEIHVLRDIDLELPERGMVAIFGRSGCGKTTLLNVIGGLDGFRSGSVTLDGKDIRRDTDRLRGEYIGYIFQNYNLQLDRTCFDNVADALRLCGIEDPAVLEERTVAALANVGMEKYRSRLPDTLSGGQQQRIAIARAIVKNPKIILADEPTGNLDEANTVMIMDLLKRISRDHLVLLVTHEANLVDFYCDRVIELSDGTIVGVRDNDDAEGYFGRGKNDIYLGELERSVTRSESTEIEWYGEMPSEPLRLTFVNRDGKLYLKLGVKNLRLVDEASEVRLHEGSFEAREREAELDAIDMSRLPPVEGKRYGRLFTFLSSIVSGHRANFANRRRGKRLLIACLSLFAAAAVLTTSVFGVAIAMQQDVLDSFSPRAFYVKTDNAETAALLRDAVGDPDSGIDYTRLHFYQRGVGDEDVVLNVRDFETFGTGVYADAFTSNAVYLEWQCAKGLSLVAGRADGLSDEEVLLSSALAEALTEDSPLGYISEPDDLLGLVLNFLYTFGGKNLRIAGIVESDERAVYISPIAMAEDLLSVSSVPVSRDRYLGTEPSADGATLVVRSGLTADAIPSVGDTVTLRGVDIPVARVYRSYSSYQEWRGDHGFKNETATNYFNRLCDEYASKNSQTGDADYAALRLKFKEEKRVETLCEYYAAIDGYMRESYVVFPENPYLWLYCEKGVSEAIYVYCFSKNISSAQEFYLAQGFYKENGRYPTETEFDRYRATHSVSLTDVMMIADRALELYQTEYDAAMRELPNVSGSGWRYYVDDGTYISLSRSFGDTSEVCYTLVHSSDPTLSESFLSRALAGSEDGGIVTPDYIQRYFSDDARDAIIADSTFLLTLLSLMCVCMFFIMRSSLVSRVKEIGICRAIGVSRRNIVFRFFVEASLIFARTVFVGYVLTGTVIGFWLARSPLVGSLFFYPWWLALLLLAAMYGVCIACGLIPVMTLLRRSPSAILAKYDI